MQMEQLTQTLSKSWGFNPTLKDECNYAISMKNTFLTGIGKIKKFQVLNADLTRRCLGFSSEDRLYLEATYNHAHFYEGDVVQSDSLRPIKFPVGQVVSHYKLMPSEDFELLRERHAYIDAHLAKNQPFSDFPATPLVNLFQLQCYDVVALEELHSQVLKHQESLARIGNSVRILIDHSKAIELRFGGTVSGISKFYMFDLDVEFTGISTHKNTPVLVYHYESRGALNVSKRVGIKEESNMGESYFYGDIYISLIDGDLERATMNESLTMSRITDSAKPLPLNRRRKIDYYRV